MRAHAHARICARQNVEHWNTLTISIDYKGISVLSLFCGCSRLEQSARAHVGPLPVGIFWAADMGAARCLVLGGCRSGAKISRLAAIVSGFPGRSWASCGRSSAAAGMADFSRFCAARWVPLEALRWKDAAKALFMPRFLARVVSLAGFGPPLGGSIGADRRRPPSAPFRGRALLFHVAAPDWWNLEPVSSARAARLRR